MHCIYILIIFLGFNLHIVGQNNFTDLSDDDPDTSSKLFDTEQIIEICLKGDIRKLFRDRTKKPNYHPILLTYTLDGKNHSLNIKVKTRGNFRKLRENCNIPPLLLNFDSVPNLSNTIFANQDKLKLVTSCVHERYVVREYLVYRLYQMITKNSFRTRLIKLCFVDTRNGKTILPKYGILLENQKEMAARNHSQLIKKLKLNPRSTDADLYLKMSAFQYLIGNTDWSVQYLHNIKLLKNKNKMAFLPVPYDFDMSGIVYAPYAKPTKELHLHSVKERRYRGYCIDDMNKFQSTFDFFNQLKNEIYSLYTDCPYIEEPYKKSTIKYLNQFYKTINHKKLSKQAFQYPCNSRGTGNVVIQGMKKH